MKWPGTSSHQKEAEAFVKSVELGTFSCEALLDACEITDFDTREEITFFNNRQRRFSQEL